MHRARGKKNVTPPLRTIRDQIGNQDFRRHQETAWNKSRRSRRVHMGWGKKNVTPPLGIGRGLNCQSRSQGGGGGRVVERGRKREEWTPIWENPGANRDLVAGPIRKGGQSDVGR